MTQHLSTMLEQAGAPPREFWEQELEIPASQIVAQAIRPGYISQWAAARPNRQAKLLKRLLASGGLTPAAHRKANAHGYVALVPYVLVHAFAKYKSPAAVTEHAEQVLSKDLLELCCKQTGDFDKVALCFALYHENPEELPLVLCLDKVYKCGFARMRLAQRLRRPKLDFAEFLIPAVATDVLSAFDRSQADDRASELKRILVTDDQTRMFIRRGERSGKILHEGKVIHGYLPEWIVLEFRDSAQRVSIASKSIGGPLKIANRIATAYFGTECKYENESLFTYRQQLRVLLDQLQEDASQELRLVELAWANSPLDGSPQLRMAGVNAVSLGPSIGHFEHAVGQIMEEIEHIECIKVLFARKRVTLRFEPTDRADDAFVVRYSDQRLSPLERQRFEDYLRDRHGITALSAEKRFCHAA